MKTCSYCKEKPIRARGLCAACYARLRKNGKLEYVKVINYCRIEGCDARVVSDGMCDKHRKRQARHGTPARTDWGMKDKHPLYDIWKYMKRTGREDVWEDFWRFVSDVGDKPNVRSRLIRKDVSKKQGPNNFYWSAPAAERSLSEITHAEYQRAWARRNPRASKQYRLKSTYGITIERYEEMLEAQSGVCAICNKTDDHFSLAVDHDHNSGEVRGLLCSQCNRALGLFKDSKQTLVAATKYLNIYTSPH